MVAHFAGDLEVKSVSFLCPLPFFFEFAFGDFLFGILTVGMN
jgi:hypothetical protein